MATVADAELISAHRRAMFSEMHGTAAEVLDRMEQSHTIWFKRMVPEGKYLGWIASDGGVAVGSAGLLILDWPPHPLDPQGEFRAYLLNVYVDPNYRRRGIARDLVEACMEAARRRGIRVLTLHASDAGWALYEMLGFKATNEKMLVNP